jgi:hypothetical protein
VALSANRSEFAMNQDEYIQNRVDRQIDWYNRKSENNQQWFRLLRIVEIVAAAAIPLLAAYADTIAPIKLIVGGLGLLVAVIAGVLGVYQFQELWTGYRTICEALKQEKYLFLTKTPPYDQGDPFPLFVQRIENTISKEHANWAQYMRVRGKEADQT